jgi:cellulose synthase/poly-beta-1,6-N-acetylglucosamine synthase-like glycosyltransferase
VENLFYLLAVVQIAVGAYLIWQGWQWLGYARRRMRTDPGFHAPRVAVLCPCKGIEPGLERNLVSLTEFNHQNYGVFFILASASDPAAAIVNRVISSSRTKAHLIVAGQPQGCGEKVNNLRVAVEELAEDFEVLVFVDSDCRPGRSWLQQLTAPLDDGRIGATTTMRWLIANRGNLATALLAAWNAPIVTMLSEKGKNFCWGGGTAIRRQVFEGVGILDEWRTSVSDDYSMTQALERAGRSIFFVPECLTVSFVETDFRGLLEFTNRQILITRVYAQKIWRAAAATHLLYCVTVVLGLALVIDDLISERPALHIAALMIFILLLSAIRASLRVVAVTEILPASKAQIMSQAWVNIALPAALPFLYFVNFTHSLITRKIRWRNIRYELISSNQTRIIND